MKKRLYNCELPIVGLTGGIATGKSAVSKILREQGYNVICADTLVKDIYKEDDTLNFIKLITPSVIINNKIDFQELRKIFFENIIIRKEIEDYIYSRIGYQFKIAESKEEISHHFIIYDAPILFEKELNKQVDVTVCVYAPREVQLERLILRDKCSEYLAEKILDDQMPIDKKKELADFVIENTGTFEDLTKRTIYTFSKIIL